MFPLFLLDYIFINGYHTIFRKWKVWNIFFLMKISQTLNSLYDIHLHYRETFQILLSLSSCHILGYWKCFFEWYCFRILKFTTVYKIEEEKKNCHIDTSNKIQCVNLLWNNTHNCIIEQFQANSSTSRIVRDSTILLLYINVPCTCYKERVEIFERLS